MRTDVADIVRQATELVAVERAKVVTQLLRTFDPPGDDVADFRDAWSDELRRREQDMESGEVELIDWQALRTSLKR